MIPAPVATSDAPSTDNPSHDRWLAAAAWWSFLVLGPFGAPVILACTWRKRGSAARRHAAAATIVDLAVFVCILPVLSQLRHGLDVVSRVQVEGGVTPAPQNTFEYVTVSAVVLASVAIGIAIICTLGGTLLAVWPNRNASKLA